jgi:nucleotide-binding universal stress UspA family protein
VDESEEQEAYRNRQDQLKPSHHVPLICRIGFAAPENLSARIELPLTVLFRAEHGAGLLPLKKMEPEQALDPSEETISSLAREPRSGIRVVLALDRWSTSTEPAEVVAPLLPPRSRVRMLTVVSYQAQSDSPWSRLGDAEEAAAQIEATRSDAFTSARRILEIAGASVSVTHRFGDPADEILNEASHWGADLILVGHHNGLARWFLGSVTESIVKRSSVPVLVVPKLRFSQSGARDGRPAPPLSSLRVRMIA